MAKTGRFIITNLLYGDYMILSVLSNCFPLKSNFEIRARSSSNQPDGLIRYFFDPKIDFYNYCYINYEKSLFEFIESISFRMVITTHHLIVN